MTNSGCPENGGSGINTESAYGGTKQDVIGNIIHDIGPARACGYIHGIYIIGQNSLIQNNIVYSTSGYGITCGMTHAMRRWSITRSSTTGPAR